MATKNTKTNVKRTTTKRVKTGAPRIAKRGNTVKVQVTLPIGTHRTLLAFAKENGTSMGDVLAGLIAKGF